MNKNPFLKINLLLSVFGVCLKKLEENHQRPYKLNHFKLIKKVSEIIVDLLNLKFNNYDNTKFI